MLQAKMKTAEAVADAYGLPIPSDKPMSCSDLNKEAFRNAYALSSRKALDRYNAKGRQLIFGPDNLRTWDEGNWETVIGLKYIWHDANNTVEVISDRLYSNLTESPPGMVYCDLLSPYRAIEWIYSTSLRKGYTT